MKTCPRCGIEKELTPENFGPAGRKGDRVYFCWCRSCSRERVAAALAEEGGPARHQQYRRRHMLRRRYGIEPEEYDQILQWQSGVCKICKKPPRAKRAGGPVTPLQVDHDHRTGAVRGLLCFKCNAGIGQFNDDPELMRAAVAYVEASRV